MDIEKFVEEYTDKTTVLGMPFETVGYSLSGLLFIVGLAYVFSLRNKGNFPNDAVIPIMVMMLLPFTVMPWMLIVDNNARDFVRDYVYKLDGTKTEITSLARLKVSNLSYGGFVLSANVDGKSKVFKVYREDVKLKKDLAEGKNPYMKYVNIKVDSKKYNDYKWLNGTHVQEIHVSKDFKMDGLVTSSIRIQ